MKKLLFLLIAIIACNFYVPTSTMERLSIKERAKPAPKPPVKKTTPVIPPTPTKQAPKPTVKTGTKPSTPIIPPAPAKPAPQPPVTSKLGEEKTPEKKTEYNFTKVYSNGNKARTLDLCIFLDPEGTEESLIRSGARYAMSIPTVNNLTSAIEAEEAIIVSYSLISAFSLLSSKKTTTRQKDTITKFLCTNKWSIFQENNNHFFILIPQSRYPEIKKLEDLETIGLNSKALKKKLYFYENVLPNNAQNKLDELIKDAPIISQSSVPDKLEYLFLYKTIKDGKIVNIRTLDVRIIMHGHGSEITSIHKKDLILQLLPTGYRKVRDVLNNIGCSISLIATCYAGETTFMNLTLNLQRTKPETLKSSLSSKNFIEVVLGVPGFPVQGEFEPENISKFFMDINNFFEDQKKIVIELITSKLKLVGKEVKYLSENITEQQILAGGKIQIPGKSIIFNLDPILKRKPNIKKSIEFSKIVKDFICESKYWILPSENNMPRVRFPGDTKMAPLKEAFSDELIEKVKKLVQDILVKKRKDLEEYEKILPGSEKIKHAGTELLKQTIDRLKIEIYDIKEYLNDLES